MSNSVSRRNFLEAGITGALALNAGMATLASASETETGKPGKPRCKIAMILYTIRDSLKTPDEVARSLERVKKTGYDFVEVTSLDDLEASAIAKMLKNTGLQAISAHSGWEALAGDPQKVIDRYKEIGCNHVVCSYMPNEFHNEEGFHKFAKLLSGMGVHFVEAGMTFAYHNHNFEFTHYHRQSGQAILVTETDPQYVQFEIDAYWVQHGGGDPAEWIGIVANRVPTVHMKDFVIYQDNPMFAEVGEGNMNWPAIIQACRKSGVQYCVVEQDRCLRDPFESIAISYKNMKAMGLS